MQFISINSKEKTDSVLIEGSVKNQLVIQASQIKGTADGTNAKRK
jgi:hypothetical protein